MECLTDPSTPFVLLLIDDPTRYISVRQHERASWFVLLREYDRCGPEGCPRSAPVLSSRVIYNLFHRRVVTFKVMFLSTEHVRLDFFDDLTENIELTASLVESEAVDIHAVDTSS